MLLLLLMLTLKSFAFPRVYPSVVTMNIERGRGRSELTIFNTEKEIKKYKVQIREKDNFGEPSQFSKYLKVFPKFIEIEPGKQQTIRVFARGIPIKEFPIGEVRASLAIEEIKAENNKKYKSKTDKSDISSMITFDYVLNMAIYGYNGKLTPKIEVSKLTHNKNKELIGKIENKGNYSYPLNYEILDSDKNIINKGSFGKVISNKNLDFKIEKIELEEKSYELVIKEGNNDRELYRKQLTF